MNSIFRSRECGRERRYPVKAVRVVCIVHYCPWAGCREERTGRMGAMSADVQNMQDRSPKCLANSRVMRLRDAFVVKPVLHRTVQNVKCGEPGDGMKVEELRLRAQSIY